ncbi:hypothetical protein EVJ58_g8133 [Rhodofomes roseus]|uniref:HAT C-terminal dimerisation domain-containing protein n=1 Tax=Rhodofomes roseus TaxID=34475 RepID=A0A4Y9XZN6_9APHY|nr:hypothetical protein EVJ58_g8133 [Rhodofomes roseus]
MKVRWSSTYMMLNRAYSLRAFVEQFMTEISRKAKEAARLKLLSLIPTPEEWRRVKLFQKILQISDRCQQKFSSETNPALHLALPALEELHSEWSRLLQDSTYAHFASGLQAGINKIAEYYDKTVVVLNPRQRFEYFKKNWSDEPVQIAAAEDLAKTIERWHRIRGDDTSTSGATTNPGAKKKAKSGRRYGSMFADLSSDDEGKRSSLRTSTQSTVVTPTAAAVSKPGWEKEFRQYLDLDFESEIFGDDDESAVQWWGKNAHRFPTWASLARDYLAIMATSVSSERAFSSAGITITKRRNRLKGDVAEALQALKCAFKKALFLYDVGPSSATEEALEAEDEELTGTGDTNNPVGEDKGDSDIAELHLELDEDAKEDEGVLLHHDGADWLTETI